MTLEYEGVVDFRGAADLAETLHLVDGKSNGWAILELGNGHYIQTAIKDDGYVIEKQLGTLSQHFAAYDVASQAPSAPNKPFWKRLLGSPEEGMSHDIFSLEDVVACFAAFLGERDQPARIQWRPMKL